MGDSVRSRAYGDLNDFNQFFGNDMLLQSFARGNSMTDLHNVVQMLKSERERLTKQMEGISAALAAFGASYRSKPGRRSTISTAGKARIAAAQRARWAKVRANSNSNVVSMPKKRTMSAAARKRIAAAQRARWAKVRAGKKR